MNILKLWKYIPTGNLILTHLEIILFLTIAIKIEPDKSEQIIFPFHVETSLFFKVEKYKIKC